MKVLIIFVVQLFLFFSGCHSASHDSRRDFSLGMDLFRRHELVAADAAFSRVDNPSLSSRALSMRVKIAWHDGCYADSLRLSESLLAENPHNITARYWKARSLVMLHREEDALAILDDLISFDEHHLPARYLRAIILEKTGQVHRALQEYRFLRRYEEDLLMARVSAARCMERSGLKSEAKIELSVAEKMSRLVAPGSKLLGRALAEAAQ